MKQKIRKKIKVWIHCALRLHSMAVVHFCNESDSERWTLWLCASCAEVWAEKHMDHSPPTEGDMAWARENMREV